MARIIRIIAVIASCAFCAGMIWCSNAQNEAGVYFCICACFVSFLVNMIATAQDNKKKLEQQEKEEAQQ